MDEARSPPQQDRALGARDGCGVHHPMVTEPVKVRCLIPLAGLGGRLVRGVGAHSVASWLAVCPLETVAEAPLGPAPANEPLVLAELPVPGTTNPTSPAPSVTSWAPVTVTVLPVSEAFPAKEPS